MEALVLKSFALAAVVFGTLVGRYIIKDNPESISGFKWGETEEEKENDRKWLGLFRSSLGVAAVLTLICGVLSLIFGSSLMFAAALVLPIVICCTYAMLRRKVHANYTNKSKVLTIAIAGLVVGLFIGIGVGIFMINNKDLSLTYGEEEVTVNGIYGKSFKYADINEISVVDTIPNIAMRTNGYSAETTMSVCGSVLTRIGEYKSTDGEKLQLYSHSDKHFIKLVLADNTVVYLNHFDAADTQQDYEMLKSKLQKQ